MVLGEAVAIGDVRAFYAVQGHVHGADAQHGRVEVEAVEQAFVEVPPQLVVAEQRGVMLSQILCGSDQEAACADRGVADHVLRLGLHQLHHRRDDVSGRAELAVLAGRGDLRQHVLVDVALGVAVAHVELVELVDHLGQQRWARNLETGVAHVARIGSAFPVERADEWEDMLVDDAKHLRAGEMLEARPAQVRIRLATLVRALGEDASLDRGAECGGLALLQLLHLVETLDEDQIGDLLDHLERVGQAA